ncbi:unnamed protein product [Adineta ricciae]|uniref:Uncharacterized protein n=1 Tax=Adineta ricciae TaxID=249248 RepID=A0A815Q0P9_ADIRI|nr:unnamed protein product [Adineta ricciae]
MTQHNSSTSAINPHEIQSSTHTAIRIPQTAYEQYIASTTAEEQLKARLIRVNTEYIKTETAEPTKKSCCGMFNAICFIISGLICIGFFISVRQQNCTSDRRWTRCAYVHMAIIAGCIDFLFGMCWLCTFCSSGE